MIYPVLFLLAMAFVWLIGVSITFLWNTIIIDSLWLSQTNLITIQSWMLIAIALLFIYYIFFTKNLESEKFQRYLWKK